VFDVVSDVCVAGDASCAARLVVVAAEGVIAALPIHLAQQRLELVP
jgi:hypothetical protein